MTRIRNSHSLYLLYAPKGHQERLTSQATEKSEYEQETPQSFKVLSLICTKYTVIKDDIENGVDLQATVHTIS